jgi:hypothetical protein
MGYPIIKETPPAPSLPLRDKGWGSSQRGIPAFQRDLPKEPRVKTPPSPNDRPKRII